MIHITICGEGLIQVVLCCTVVSLSLLTQKINYHGKTEGLEGFDKTLNPKAFRFDGDQYWGWCHNPVYTPVSSPPCYVTRQPQKSKPDSLLRHLPTTSFELQLRVKHTEQNNKTSAN